MNIIFLPGEFFLFCFVDNERGKIYRNAKLSIRHTRTTVISRIRILCLCCLF